MMTLNTKGLTLTRDQAEEDNRCFVPVSKTLVCSCFAETGDGLSVLRMHAMLISLCFIALVVGAGPLS